MRTLVVGAGAIGGYFGGRLLESGREVTFLVRPQRAAQLASAGLVLRGRSGDVTLPHPPTVLTGAAAQAGSFDLILLACKAYDLEGAVESMAPFVAAQSIVLPLLNGLDHLALLDARFGRERVLGGLCVISVTREEDGSIVHFNNIDALVFGERDAGELDSATSTRTQDIAALFAGARFQSRLSPCILQEMWEKWVFIAACAAITCLMRASIGEIAAAGGDPHAVALLDECAAIAAAEGYAPRPEMFEQYRATLTRTGSPLVASMLRDIERHAPVEADHLIGSLLRRGDAHAISAPTLRLAYVHLKAYEARRAQELTSRP
jgi:2-dehydropantoate 2-reductase